MSEDTQDAFERGFMLGFDEGVKQGKELGRQIPTWPYKYPSYPYSPVIGSSVGTDSQ
jgi:flagellar biosynthesis/type III secretory pathway protein FliH